MGGDSLACLTTHMVDKTMQKQLSNKLLFNNKLAYSGLLYFQIN